MRFRRNQDREQEAALRRRPGRAIRRAAVGLLGVVAIILAIAVVALELAAVNDRRALETSNRAYAAVQRTQHLQAIALAQGCERLNTKQAEDNRSQQADYFYDKIFIALASGTPARNRRQARQLRQFLVPLRAAAEAKAWVPLVPDCGHVGLSYRPPRPVQFAEHQPPPAALTAPAR